MMTGTFEIFPVVIEMAVISGFVIIMVGLASYVFKREVNKPF
jgi:ABC-2 type transport system permease protein